jgi:hypothetical protein
MRKMLWGCAAAAVVAVLVAGYVAVEYAHDHPTTWVGRCLVPGYPAAAPEVEEVPSTPQTTEAAFHSADAAPETGGVCEGGDGGASHETRAAEDICPIAPAVLPGEVVMHEDADLPARPMPPVRDIVGVLPFLGAADDSEDSRMPAVEDDAPKMPRVPGDDDGDQPPHPKVNKVLIRPSDLGFFDIRLPF